MTTTSSAAAFELPERDLFDVVAVNDVVALLTVVRGDNPFDVSPGMELIRRKRKQSRQPYEENPLVTATTELQIDVARIPRAKDRAGNGATHVAAGNGLALMLSILVEECGCAVDAYNEAGFTPLQLAALHGHLDCVRLLCGVGAEPLSVTRGPATASSATDVFYGGRTALFLAHSRQQAAVVSFLVPFYEELLRGHCAGQGSTQVWAAAVAQHNTQLLSLLLEALECVGTIQGPLPLSFDFDVEGDLIASLPSVAASALPSDQRMSREQHLLFERLVRLGYVTGDTLLSDGSTVLKRVLSTAQVKAWRLLVSAGGVQPHCCDLDTIASGGYSGNGEEELRLLVSEATAAVAYLKAKEAYVLKGDNAARREALQSTRGEWKAFQRQLTQRHLSPARCP